MAYLNEKQRKLCLDFALKRVGEDDFMRDFPLTPDQRGTLPLAILKAALREHDPSDVECGMDLAFRFSLSDAYGETLTRLLEADWHKRHEDAASGLQELAWPGAVDALYKAAESKHPYLDFDDNYALGVKCIWALGDIRTPEAVVRLEALTKSENPILREAAEEQIERIREGRVRRRRSR